MSSSFATKVLEVVKSCQNLFSVLQANLDKVVYRWAENHAAHVTDLNRWKQDGPKGVMEEVSYKHALHTF